MLLCQCVARIGVGRLSGMVRVVVHLQLFSELAVVRQNQRFAILRHGIDMQHKIGQQGDQTRGLSVQLVKVDAAVHLSFEQDFNRIIVDAEILGQHVPIRVIFKELEIIILKRQDGIHIVGVVNRQGVVVRWGRLFHESVF